MGLVIITNNDFICDFDIPPTVVNNYYNENNISKPLVYDILENDYSDCGGLNYSNINLLPISGIQFLDSYFDNGFLKLLDNQTNYIPGNYSIEYNILSNNGLESNNGLININLSYNPLEVNNINNTKTCIGNTSSIDYSFNINEGVPIYSYSYDNIIFIPISGFNNVDLSGSILSTTSSIYVKDYIGNIYSQSINPYYDDINYNIITTKSNLCFPTGGYVNIISSDDITYTLNGEPTIYNPNSYIFLNPGIYTSSILNNNGCIIEDYFNITYVDDITYTLSTSSVLCYNGNSGIIEM